MRNSKNAPTVVVNPKRKVTKKARGFGMGMVESKIGFKEGDVVRWCQSKDPLFKVKGKERAVRMKDYK